MGEAALQHDRPPPGGEVEKRTAMTLDSSCHEAFGGSPEAVETRRTIDLDTLPERAASVANNGTRSARGVAVADAGHDARADRLVYRADGAMQSFLSSAKQHPNSQGPWP
jgi:hypothetical protein